MQSDADVNLVRVALNGLIRFLDEEYKNLGLTYEGDMHCLVVEHLRRELGRNSIVGAKHRIVDWYPDVLCYRNPVPGKAQTFIEDPSASIQAIIELKFRSSLKDDLEKLAAIQKYFFKEYKTKPLIWMVYGDHFNKDVHEANYKTQLKREKQVLDWVDFDPDYRGCTIHKTGIASNSDSHSQRQNRCLLNAYFWSRDGKSNTQHLLSPNQLTMANTKGRI